MLLGEIVTSKKAIAAKEATMTNREEASRNAECLAITLPVIGGVGMLFTRIESEMHGLLAWVAGLVLALCEAYLLAVLRRLFFAPRP